MVTAAPSMSNVQSALLPVTATPIVRWVGGKKWLVPLLSANIRAHLAKTKGRYIEPFLGGGAIALSLGLPKMILGDCCQPLVTMYRAIVKNPTAVAWALSTLVEQGTDKETYLRIRAARYPNPVMVAAQFIYQNKVCFNGLYRENSKGGFNVPHGKPASGAAYSFPTLEALTAVAAAIKTSDVNVRDFRDTIAMAAEGDVVYGDSPYYNTFSDYTAEGFDDNDHIDLAESLKAAMQRGATIIASNSDHERVRELYTWTNVIALTERHMVGAKADRRGARNAVLITNDPTLLPYTE